MIVDIRCRTRRAPVDCRCGSGVCFLITRIRCLRMGGGARRARFVCVCGCASLVCLTERVAEIAARQSRGTGTLNECQIKQRGNLC